MQLGSVPENIKDSCELYHEVCVRQKTIDPGIISWKQGIILFYEKYCSCREDIDFDTFRKKWPVIRLLRLRKLGVSHSKEHMRNLLNARANIRGAIGLLSDSSTQKLYVLSKCERETINRPFCERLQLTNDEILTCHKWCKDNKELYLQTWGNIPKRVREKSEEKQVRFMFEKILSMYSLKTVKHVRKATAAMHIDIPSRPNLAQKKKFMEKVKEKFPELYERARGLCQNGVKDFLAKFKQTCFRKGEWSLQSTFSIHGNPIRLYWDLDTSKISDEMAKVNHTSVKLPIAAKQAGPGFLFLPDE